MFSVRPGWLRGLWVFLLVAACGHGATPLRITEQQLNERLLTQYREPRLLNLELMLGSRAQLYVTGVSLDLLGEGEVLYRVTGDFDIEFGGTALTDPVLFSLEALGSLGLVPDERALYPLQVRIERFTIETEVAAVHLPLQEVLGQRVAEALEELAIYQLSEQELPNPGQISALAIDTDALQLLSVGEASP
ncbi:DUF1439 domain-containing protein [Aestuariirhabdus litorea]|uniref:DUF1439 domain-containing protein n=1 Tax=Aestuariirhabdus litorea TaxID=2528527 RepID=A0A3P3VP29_9GAMM|nr:DUF1439 domain-containing protein [Aestuariirhabdus litorea]RRJ83406.1 DUF1439 domain-containing protein [Aestuariirhabdus litorea]RWW93567.1 DUF1439 domain-containing protein [Endozoicomonadaceae bacterium GTF-13]